MDAAKMSFAHAREVTDDANADCGVIGSHRAARLMQHADRTQLLDVLDRFVHALRQQGLTVSLAGQIAPSANGFFSVPAEQVRVNDSQVNAFVYYT